MYESSFDYSYTATGAEAGGIIAAMFGTYLLVTLVILGLVLAGMWKMFVKAGKPGWAALVPIYNIIVLLEIIEKPLWWIVLFLVPYVNVVAYLLVGIELAKKFGKSTAFGVVALWLFAPIGYMMLGFGKDQYKGSAPAKAEEAK